MLFKCTFEERDSAFKTVFEEVKTVLKISVDEIFRVNEQAELYAGEYEVTPTVEGFLIPTAKKLMEKDVKINAIPYFEVSNNSGGNTVYIGKEIE